MFDPRTKRIGHPFHANRVEMAAEHDCRARHAAVEYADDVVAAGRCGLKDDVETSGGHPLARCFSRFRFSRGAWHE